MRTVLTKPRRKRKDKTQGGRLKTKKVIRKVLRAKIRLDEDFKTLPQTWEKSNGRFSQEMSRLQMGIIDIRHLEKIRSRADGSD